MSVRAIDTYTLLDLPFKSEIVTQEYLSPAQRLEMRDLALQVLRGKTALIRLAEDYHQSYLQADQRTLLHYRDYLLSEAVLHSLRSMLYYDDHHRYPNVLADQASEVPWNRLWNLDVGAQPRFGGTLGSLAQYFLVSDIEGYPLEAMDSLVDTLWSRNGADPTLPAGDRFQQMFNRLNLRSGLLEAAPDRVEALYQSASPESPTYNAYLYGRREFVEPEDLEDLGTKLLMGTYSSEAVSLFALLCADDERALLEQTLRYTSSVARPGGLHLLLQATAVEGYIDAAMLLNNLPADISEIPLRDFITEQDPIYSELKLEIASALYLSASAFSAQLYSSQIDSSQRSMSNAYNSALYWLQSSGSTELDLDSPYFINTFFSDNLPEVASNFPTLSVNSPIYVGDPVLASLQGLPARGSGGVLTPARGYGYDDTLYLTPSVSAQSASANSTAQTASAVTYTLRPSGSGTSVASVGQVGPAQIDVASLQSSLASEAAPGFVGPAQISEATLQSTLASERADGFVGPRQDLANGQLELATEESTLAAEAEEGFVGPQQIAEVKTSSASSADSGVSVFVAHDGEETVLTPEELAQKQNVSTPVVVKMGDPSVDLTNSINTYIDQQQSSYEVVNTVHLTNTPRGRLGLEELIRGMVSFLFRDSTSDEAANRAKIDGKREEHTSRVGGMLDQLKATHLDSEIAALKAWSDLVDTTF